MTSVQALREFINERLTAAAGEIFTVFEQTIVQFEEEIDRQRRPLETSFNRAESPQQHIVEQKTISSLKQEEHEAPHIKEEEDPVEASVPDGERENSLHSVRDSTTQRLTAAAVEIFTLFQQTIVQYKEEIDRQRRLLEITWNPQIQLHRTGRPQHRDCRKKQLFKQEKNDCLKQEEPEPQQIEEHEELGTRQKREQLIVHFENGSFLIPPVEEHSDLSEPEEAPDTEQFLSQDSEVKQKETDSELMRRAELRNISMFHSYCSTSVPVSEKQTECEKRPEKSPEKPPEKLICETCGRILSNQASFKKHMKIHTAEKPYSCKICGKRFLENCNFLRHMKVHTVTKPYFCETCRKGFRAHSTLLFHQKVHAAEKPLSCETCGKSFSEDIHYIHHVRTHTNKPYSCETCRKSFREHSKLLHHMKTHKVKKPFTCETCGKGFSHNSSLFRHMKIHSDGVKNVPASEKQAECETPLSVQTSGETVRHKHESGMNQEVETATDEKICQTCGKSFSTRSNFLVHMRIHTGEKPYSCETCGKSFRQRRYLSVHVRTHTGEKPYPCETCGKRFSHKVGLLLHVRVHTGEKPYSCETCGTRFGRRYTLLVHMRTHTGEKPYSCETCGKSFSQSSTLAGHMRTHR
ncbi:gastrula zinc finger protein XlCGF57.1-like isoform X2 [Salarias fasciatus]|uniref:gastrula zinc finger protein XlCGF57.1-like isoform X2 n=1 Tax=Salarias fasciatus TaxID=181472 RepID=UPI001176BA1F|nr:gastrula zinc finger protein XlCGF57.1-like isoform X2 [Salarias fasciatus]